MKKKRHREKKGQLLRAALFLFLYESSFNKKITIVYCRERIEYRRKDERDI